MTTTVTNMDARVTRTMAACTTTAQQIIHIESRLDQMVLQLQLIVANTATTATHNLITHTSDHTTNDETTSPNLSTAASHSTLHSSNNSMGTATSKSSTNSDTNKSPKKKRVKQSDQGDLATLTSTTSHLKKTIPSEQQGSQYNSKTPSDGGSHE
jgi:activator of HSP90 ATPase